MLRLLDVQKPLEEIVVAHNRAEQPAAARTREEHFGADRIGVAGRPAQAPAGDAQVFGDNLLEAVERGAVLVERGLERELVQGNRVTRLVRIVQRPVVAVPIADGEADAARLVDPSPSPAPAEDPVQEVRADHGPLRQAAQVGVVVDGDGQAGGLGHAGLEVLAAEERQVGHQLVRSIRAEQPRRGNADGTHVAQPPALLLQEAVDPSQQGRNERVDVVRVLGAVQKFSIDLVVRIGEQPHLHAQSGADVDRKAQLFHTLAFHLIHHPDKLDGVLLNSVLAFLPSTSITIHARWMGSRQTSKNHAARLSLYSNTRSPFAQEGASSLLISPRSRTIHAVRAGRLQMFEA